MKTKELIQEYEKLNKSPNLNLRHKVRERIREIIDELQVFEVADKFIFSGGALISLGMVDWMARGNRDKFIEMERQKGIKDKNYPAESWIRPIRLIKRLEKKHNIRFSYSIDNDKLGIKYL